MKSQDYLSRIIFFPTVHVKQITTSNKKQLQYKTYKTI